MQMHAQMYKCTSYLQLATWTYGQVTRTVIFNPPTPKTIQFQSFNWFLLQ